MNNQWTYSFHRFNSEAEYTKVLTLLQWADGPPHGVALDVIGTLYETVTIPSDWTPDTVLPAPQPLEGYHVNAAWMGVEMPQPFKNAELTPRNPQRVWA